MKLKLLLVLIAFILVCPIFGQNGSAKRVAILETVDKEGKVSYGVKLMVRSKLSAVITSTPGYEGYDRVDVASILGEHDFQRTGLVSDNDIKRLGEMIGADYILVAEVAYLNSSYIFLSAKILDVETARVERTADIQTQATVEELEKNCRVLAGKLLNINIDTGAVRGELMIDGNRYVGEYKNGKPHGKGIMYYGSNSKLKSYEGDWVYGNREGKGTLIWNSGHRYVGDWKNDHREGYGVQYYSDGEIYEGNWLDDKRHGNGKITYSSVDSANRKSYEGDWYNDIRQGIGTMIWNNGDKYVGSWKNGSRYGKGIQYYTSGDRYDGDWVDSKWHGKGTYYWTDGKYEVANYENGKENGSFTYYFADGDKRVGTYIDGKEEGSATYYFASGGYVKEYWVDGKRHGSEEWYNRSGHKYRTKIYEFGVLKKTKNHR